MMRWQRKGIRVLACAAVIFASAASATESMENTDHLLRAIVQRPDRPLASLSVMAIQGGKITYQQQFGDRYIDQHDPAKNLKADASTMYRVASVSKMVTAIAAMRLVEQGRLNLDADIGNYLGYRVRNPHYPQTAITARMLLSHTSSLRDDAGYNFPADVSMQSFLVPGGAHYGDGKQWAGQAESAKAGDFAPGHFFHYVNLNWGVLGSVMEAVTGQRFDELMQELVLRPLHITGAYHPESLSAHDVADLAVLYRKQKNEVWDVHGPWVAQTDDLHAQVPEPRAALAHYVPGTNATLFSPQGGLRISVRGLSHIMLMLMNQGESDGVRFLQASTVQTMLSQQWRYDPLRLNGDDYRGLFQSWGLGVQRFMDVSAAHYGDRLLPPSVQTTSNGFSAIGHLGFAYGLESGFFFDPRSKNGMIYVIGGVGADPETHLGNYSSLSIWEEEILSALYQHLQ